MTKVDAIQADNLCLPGVRHGFLTRVGGASTGLYEGLNCGRGSNDDRTAVEENRRRAAAYAEVLPENLLSVYQVHSDRVVIIDESFSPQDAPQADAMATNTPGVGLGILTADCAPVLLADAEAGVIGAAHAGWGGALGGVLSAVVAKMIGLGARREAIAASVGPTISQRNYEVGPEFIDRFLDEDPENQRFFAGAERDGHAMFDLPGYCLRRLREEGIDAAWVGRCTYEDEARFYSYRRATHRSEEDYGRQISVISLADAAMPN